MSLEGGRDLEHHAEGSGSPGGRKGRRDGGEGEVVGNSTASHVGVCIYLQSHTYMHMSKNGFYSRNGFYAIHVLYEF